MTVFQRPDGTVRLLAVLALFHFLGAIAVPVFWFHETVRPLAVAMLFAMIAAIPLDEPALATLPWRQRLRTPYGVIACAAWGLWIVTFAWSVIRR
jgi:hypothetical protein